ncbi:MAG TPA: serine hydrolase domain-containing protein [Chthoniobacterales bacterium]
MQAGRVALVFLILCSSLMGIRSYPQSRGHGSAANKADATTKTEPTLSDRIDNLVEAQVRKLGIPGYSLAVISNKVTVIQKGYGFADLEAERPVTPNTVFGLASVTKTFTALALLMLVDEGKIRLDYPLSRYITALPPNWRKLTVGQLASMTAGIPKGITPEVAWTDEMALLENEPLVSEPGTQFLYSNCSYRIIGTVIERVSGQSYMEFLRTRILGPLGMPDTGPTDRKFDPPIAVAYAKNTSAQLVPLAGYKNPEINFSAGMLASNSVDLAKYATALLAHRLLSPAGYELLWKKRPELPSGVRPEWAFGWASGTTSGHLRLAMNGTLPGVASTIMIFPDDKLIVIGLANIDSPEVHDLTRAVASMALGTDAGSIEEDQ